jgi:hypothetical protein
MAVSSCSVRCERKEKAAGRKEKKRRRKDIRKRKGRKRKKKKKYEIFSKPEIFWGEK